MPKFLYTALIYCTLPFVPLKLLWRGIKQPDYLKHWGERLGFYQHKVDKPVIWLHCVSVGETRAAAPLITALQSEYPDHQILLTHTTPTGRETSEQLFADTVHRVYLPYDVPFAVRRFIRYFKPELGLIMETELWFNLIDQAKKQQVPLLLLNARMSEKSAVGYMKLGQLVHDGLNNLHGIAAQTEADAKRLQALGAQQVSVAGNLKFDVTPPGNSAEKGDSMRKLFNTSQSIFLAASTREGEEALIVDAINDLNVLTVIVPRHPQRFNEVAALLDERKINYVRRSTLTTPISNEVKVVLGDSMGEMFTYYAACDFTYIGGSLLNYGGQNLIEAATMGKPVLVGPHTFNFAAASEDAIESGAALRVADVPALRQQIETLANNATQREAMREAALQFSQASTGATARMMTLIKTVLT